MPETLQTEKCGQLAWALNSTQLESFFKVEVPKIYAGYRQIYANAINEFKLGQGMLQQSLNALAKARVANTNQLRPAEVLNSGQQIEALAEQAINSFNSCMARTNRDLSPKINQTLRPQIQKNTHVLGDLRQQAIQNLGPERDPLKLLTLCQDETRSHSMQDKDNPQYAIGLNKSLDQTHELWQVCFALKKEAAIVKQQAFEMTLAAQRMMRQQPGLVGAGGGYGGEGGGALRPTPESAASSDGPGWGVVVGGAAVLGTAGYLAGRNNPKSKFKQKPKGQPPQASQNSGSAESDDDKGDGDKKEKCPEGLVTTPEGYCALP